MTNQITIPVETFDAMREALEEYVNNDDVDLHLNGIKSKATVALARAYGIKQDSLNDKTENAAFQHAWKRFASTIEAEFRTSSNQNFFAAGWRAFKEALTAANAVQPQATEPAGWKLTDEHLKAATYCREAGHVSVSLVQRKLRTSYNFAQEVCQHIINAGLVPGLTIAPSLTTAAAPEAP